MSARSFHQSQTQLNSPHAQESKRDNGQAQRAKPMFKLKLLSVNGQNTKVNQVPGSVSARDQLASNPPVGQQAVTMVNFSANQATQQLSRKTNIKYVTRNANPRLAGSAAHDGGTSYFNNEAASKQAFQQHSQRRRKAEQKNYFGAISSNNQVETQSRGQHVQNFNRVHSQMRTIHNGAGQNYQQQKSQPLARGGSRLGRNMVVSGRRAKVISPQEQFEVTEENARAKSTQRNADSNQKPQQKLAPIGNQAMVGAASHGHRQIRASQVIQAYPLTSRTTNSKQSQPNNANQIFQHQSQQHFFAGQKPSVNHHYQQQMTQYGAQPTQASLQVNMQSHSEPNQPFYNHVRIKHTRSQKNVKYQGPMQARISQATPTSSVGAQTGNGPKMRYRSVTRGQNQALPRPQRSMYDSNPNQQQSSLNAAPLARQPAARSTLNGLGIVAVDGIQRSASSQSNVLISHNFVRQGPPGEPLHRQSDGPKIEQPAQQAPNEAPPETLYTLGQTDEDEPEAAHSRSKVATSQTRQTRAPFPMSTPQDKDHQTVVQRSIEQIYSSVPPEHTANRASTDLDSRHRHNPASNRSGSTGRFRASNAKRSHTYNNGQRLLTEAGFYDSAQQKPNTGPGMKSKHTGSQQTINVKTGAEFDSRRSSNSQARRHAVGKRPSAITSTVSNGVKFQNQRHVVHGLLRPKTNAASGLNPRRRSQHGARGQSRSTKNAIIDSKAAVSQASSNHGAGQGQGEVPRPRQQQIANSENFSTIIVNPNGNATAKKAVLTYHDSAQAAAGRTTASPGQSLNSRNLISSQKLAMSSNAPGANPANSRGKYASSVQLSERIYNEQTSAMNTGNESLRTDSQKQGYSEQQQYYAHQGRKLVKYAPQQASAGRRRGFENSGTSSMSKNRHQQQQSYASSERNSSWIKASSRKANNIGTASQVSLQDQEQKIQMILDMRKDSDPMVRAHHAAKRNRNKDGAAQIQSQIILRNSISNTESRMASARGQRQTEEIDYGNALNPFHERRHEVNAEGNFLEQIHFPARQNTGHYSTPEHHEVPVTPQVFSSSSERYLKANGVGSAHKGAYHVYRDDYEEFDQPEHYDLPAQDAGKQGSEPRACSQEMNERMLVKRSSVDVQLREKQETSARDEDEGEKLQIILTPTANIHRSLEALKSRTNNQSMQGSVADTARSIYSNQVTAMQRNSATVFLLSKNQNLESQKQGQPRDTAAQAEEPSGENGSPEAKLGFYQRIQRQQQNQDKQYFATGSGDTFNHQQRPQHGESAAQYYNNGWSALAMNLNSHAAIYSATSLSNSARSSTNSAQKYVLEKNNQSSTGGSKNANERRPHASRAEKVFLIRPGSDGMGIASFGGSNNHVHSVASAEGPPQISLQDDQQWSAGPQGAQDHHVDDSEKKQSAPTRRLGQFEAELVRKSQLESPDGAQPSPPEEHRPELTQGLGQQRNPKHEQIQRNLAAAPHQHTPQVTASDLLGKQPLAVEVESRLESGRRNRGDGDELAEVRPSPRPPASTATKQSKPTSPTGGHRNTEQKAPKLSELHRAQPMLKRASPTIMDLQRRQGSQQTVVSKEVSSGALSMKPQSDNSRHLKTIGPQKRSNELTEANAPGKDEILQSIANLSEILPADDDQGEASAGLVTFQQLQTLSNKDNAEARAEANGNGRGQSAQSRSRRAAGEPSDKSLASLDLFSATPEAARQHQNFVKQSEQTGKQLRALFDSMESL